MRTDRRLFITIVLIFFCAIYGLANGSPVTKYSSINRLANPEPLSINEIYIVNEQVNISHVDGYNCFDITYKLRNESDKNFPDIDYGFPIDYLVADSLETPTFVDDEITEKISERGWNDELIKDVVFTFNGKQLSHHISKESVSAAYYDTETFGGDSILVDAVIRRWFYTIFKMGPREEAVLNVRYRVFANKLENLYADQLSYYTRKSEAPNTDIFNHPLISRYFCDNFTILYDFTPAKHFGKGSFYIHVDINLDNLIQPHVNFEEYDFYAQHITRRYCRPDDKLELLLHHSPDLSKDNIERIIKPFIISASEYSLEQNRNHATIKLKKPLFVSEIACEIDTTQVKSINSVVTYADGQKKKYIYKPNDYLNPDRVMKSPMILTITDLFHDTAEWTKIDDDNYIFDRDTDFDQERFKIKEIELIFNLKPSPSSLQAFGDIRLLDSRFSKQP